MQPTSKALLYGVVKTDYIGALVYSTADELAPRVRLPENLYIKSYKRLDAMESGSHKLGMHLYDKDSFRSSAEKTQHNQMVKGLGRFLQSLHQRKQCAVLSNDMILVPSGQGRTAPAAHLHIVPTGGSPPGPLPPNHSGVRLTSDSPAITTNPGTRRLSPVTRQQSRLSHQKRNEGITPGGVSMGQASGLGAGARPPTPSNTSQARANLAEGTRRGRAVGDESSSGGRNNSLGVELEDGEIAEHNHVPTPLPPRCDAGRQTRTLPPGGRDTGRGSGTCVFPPPHPSVSGQLVTAAGEPVPHDRGNGDGPRDPPLGDGAVGSSGGLNGGGSGGGIIMDSFYMNLADHRHTWAFGAAAELIHNSADAKATEVRIRLENLGPAEDTNFVVIDDGSGMTHAEMKQLFTLGRGNEDDVANGERIGCNGVGFQQGVLRLGDTTVVVSVRGRTTAANLSPKDVPTASFGILSIEAYRSGQRTAGRRQPVVLQHATLNLLTMKADERHNTPEQFDAVMVLIRSLVPYFTREYLTAYAARFVTPAHESTWEICNVKSSTSIFISRLRPSPNPDRTNRLELIKDIGGNDIRLEGTKGDHFRLPHRPMDYSLRRFCEQMFLDPKMKIYVQGSEVKASGIMSSLANKETYDIDIYNYLNRKEIGFSSKHGRLTFREASNCPPSYDIAVHVGQDRWHRDKGLSGIMVYFENCLVDSYTRGQGLPEAVQENEVGYLAIMAFRGTVDKRHFRPNPTKVGFPVDNVRYIRALQAAGEALTQVIEQVQGTPMMVDTAEGVDAWLQCGHCGKYRKVAKTYCDAHVANDWHCGVEGSPVPLPETESSRCDFPEDKNYGPTVGYGASAEVSRRAPAPRKVFSSDFVIEKTKLLGEGSSASVFAGSGYQGDGNVLKVFKTKRTWSREKDILWALNQAGRSHPNICTLVWVCQEKLTLALKPLYETSYSLSQALNSDSDHELTNHQRLGIAEKVADALRYLHKRQFSHNDVQPSNVVLGPNPKEDVLLVDFGEACKFSTARSASINTPLRYSPPEVLNKRMVIPGRERDVFAFGVVLVELFAGHTLFAQEVIQDETKLKESLVALRDFGDLRTEPSCMDEAERKQQIVPGLLSLFSQSGMKELGEICQGCVQGDPKLRLGSEKVVEKLANFRDNAEFHWRHGTSIVYHTLEPGDDLHFSEDGAFVKLSRLPRPSGKNMFMEHGFGLAPILEIDLSKLGCGNFKEHIFDGTQQGRGATATTVSKIPQNFTAEAEEVIIDVDVPTTAVRAVYNLGFTQRPGESSAKHKKRVGHLLELHKAVSEHALSKSSKFAAWEKSFNKFIRKKGDVASSPYQRINDQARVLNENGRLEDVLTASYCALSNGHQRLKHDGMVTTGGCVQEVRTEGRRGGRCDDHNLQVW